MDSHTPTKTLLQLMSFLLIAAGQKGRDLQLVCEQKQSDSVSARLLMCRF